MAPKFKPTKPPKGKKVTPPKVTLASLMPFKPMTPGQINFRAGRQTQTALAPQLSGLIGERNQEGADFRLRGGLIHNLALGRNAQMQDAINRANSALNSLVVTNRGVNQQSQNALAAGLRGLDKPASEAASALGGIGPEGSGTLLSDAEQNRQSLEAQTQQQGQAALGQATANAAIPGAEEQQAQQELGTAHQKTLADIRNRTAQVQGQRSGLMAQAVQDLTNLEIAKRQFGDQHANMLFQQYLASKQFNLAAQDQTFQQWLAKNQLGLQTQGQNFQQTITTAGVTGKFHGKDTLALRQFLHQQKIDWANVGINRKQAQAQIDQINADAAKTKDNTKKEQAKVRGQAIINGLSALDSFMQPKPGENPNGSAHGDFPFAPGQPPVKDGLGNVKTPATRPYRRTYDDALRILMRYMRRKDAIRQLAMSNYGDWRRHAQIDLHPPGHPTSGNAPAGPGHTGTRPT